MKKIILLLLTLSLSFGKIFSQCIETNETKILLVGDSWAWYMNTDGTFNNVFKTWGFSNYKYLSNATLAVNGAQTDDVMKPACETEILNQLNAHPEIKAVHLSIGGNDFLGGWNISMSQGATDTLIAAVFVRLDSIFRYIDQCRPGIQILWSGYCYTNFKEVITNFIAPTSHPFYNTWHGMGDPDFIQINTMQNYISDQVVAYCNTHPNVHFVNASGLMQYEFGQPNPLQGGLSPTGTYAAFTAPLPLGFPDYPSPVASMRDYGIAKDCYHLSAAGYKYLIAYHTQKFYHKLLMDDLYLLSDNSTQTGTISSAGNTDTLLYIGENSGEQFSTVLSFNTTAMADTTLRKASLFLRRKALTGTNPITGALQVKVKNGNFGTTVNVDAADATDAGDASGTPCIFGSYGADGDWVRLDLPASILSHINHTGTTQFIVSAPAATAGKVQYYSSSDPDFAPVLNLAYGQAPSAIKETTDANEFSIYPNPTNGLLNIERGSELITHLEVSNMLGQVVLQPQMQQNTINISTLPSGIYMLNITTKSGKTSQRIVKD